MTYRVLLGVALLLACGLALVAFDATAELRGL
jgi:hypothetical protein